MTLPDPAADPADNAAADPTTLALPDTIARGYLVVTVLAALAGLLVHTLLPAVLPTALPASARLVLQAGFGLLIVGCLLALRQRGAALQRCLVGAALAGVLMVAVVAGVTGWGLRTGGLVFLPIGVMLACTLTSRPRGLLVAGSAAAVLLLLAGTNMAGLAPVSAGVASPLAAPPFTAPPFTAAPITAAPITAPVASAGPPLLQLLVLHLAALAVATFAGLTLARLVGAHVRRAVEREQRFRDLLGLAASAYWETDAGLRLTRLSRREGASVLTPFSPVPQAVGRLFWDIAGVQFDAQVIDRLRADMESRSRLAGVPFTSPYRDGSLRQCRLSGEPRFDADGRFVGYWGVARDVTDEHQARLALAATETRYHDLFNRIPTPLTLHSQGQIVDANAAAARLLGYATVDAMLGHDIVSEHVVQADRARVLARQAQLDALPRARCCRPPS